jgi:hypothetical protein
MSRILVKSDILTFLDGWHKICLLFGYENPDSQESSDETGQMSPIPISLDAERSKRLTKNENQDAFYDSDYNRFIMLTYSLCFSPCLRSASQCFGKWTKLAERRPFV